MKYLSYSFPAHPETTSGMRGASYIEQPNSRIDASSKPRKEPGLVFELERTSRVAIVCARGGALGKSSGCLGSMGMSAQELLARLFLLFEASKKILKVHIVWIDSRSR